VSGDDPGSFQCGAGRRDPAPFGKAEAWPLWSSPDPTAGLANDSNDALRDLRALAPVDMHEVSQIEFIQKFFIL